MNLTSARFYAYLFFFFSENGETPRSFLCYDKWKDFHNLQAYDPAEVDLGRPDLTVHKIAAKDDLSVCVFRLHETDLVEIECRNISEDSPLEFWKKCSADFEKQITDVPRMGAAQAYFCHSDDLSVNPVKKIVKSVNWKFSEDFPSAQIPDLGNLYRIENHKYILLSQDKDPSDFLGRDFAIMESFVQKLEFEEKELREIQTLNETGKNLLQGLPDLDNPLYIEKNFPIIQQYQSYFHRNTIRTEMLRQTLEINIPTNLAEFCKRYKIQNDTIFSPLIDAVKRKEKQLEYDLKYARLTIEETESRLNLLKIKIENRRLKVQRRVEALFTAIMVGQIFIPFSGWDWTKKGALMAAVLVLIYTGMKLMDRFEK